MTIASASSQSESVRTVHQPIHPGVRPLLDPEYVAFHDEVLQYIPRSESQPFDPVVRTHGMPGASEPIPVGSTRDIKPNERWDVRVFTPNGERPEKGWPVLVWFHGGGWVLGGVSSENHFLTRICEGASCVVVSVNYRHAPEHVFPAAVDDAFEGLVWVHDKGAAELGINPKRIAVGGSSSGGNISAVVSHKAATSSPPIPLIFQLMCVPVIDNTLTAESPLWQINKNAPWLTPARMLWYRRMYLPNESDWARLEASPNQGDPKHAPRTWIGVAEQDLLRPEGEAYGEFLRAGGVPVEVKVYKGSTHSMMNIDVTDVFLTSITRH
ncbi:hypothetical protein FISHEDRAFT_58692 [Fistulina hepatica ATCC 64428]|uniref:Alpha/beta hydrolase fold-3 domain-containing protein n=1 Tax=Fistulina hepatica ATCC 64428 TaxID=1128425 RepID=A0A0D7AFV4_9AGAR|nr:hypothetical protein FISHEDRAFT_58692 [Fistulina hepatica ATCC 64428]